MNIIKTVTIILALMTNMVFADFTIKDLFVSGGTQTTEERAKMKHEDKDSKNVRTNEDSK